MMYMQCGILFTVTRESRLSNLMGLLHERATLKGPLNIPSSVKTFYFERYRPKDARVTSNIKCTRRSCDSQQLPQMLSTCYRSYFFFFLMFCLIGKSAVYSEAALPPLLTWGKGRMYF